MPVIGFIGQGFVGKSIADDVEARGYRTVRYALEAPYADNGAAVAAADIVFIAVPTPSTPEGFDAGVLETVLAKVGTGKTAVVKSTVVPGTTERLQAAYPDRTILFSPEFLIESRAAADAAAPIMTLVGMPADTPALRARAREVLAVLPESPYARVCLARSAELFKYAHNIHGVLRIVFANVLYDMAKAHDVPWDELAAAMAHDPFMNERTAYYNNPVHGKGRGAGGHCFIKDLAAFRGAYEAACGADTHGIALLRSIEAKNSELLRGSGKDLDLLAGVYGDELPA